MRLEIKNDRVIDVQGKFRGELEAFFEKTDPILWFISEVSMGLNPETPIDPNPTHIVEEKKLGTAHFGHGGNASYGKRIGFHLDGVVNCPTISVGDETIMKEGKIPYDIIDSESTKWLGKYNLIAV